MSSQSHSVAGIIVQCIARVMSAHGGDRPVLTRSRLPAASGKLLAGRLRRAQTLLRMRGIEITVSREGEQDRG